MTRAIYLEGRPQAHPLHRRFAMTVCDKVEYIDPVIRWQDRKLNPVALLRAWIINARHLKNVCKDYDVVLVDNLHFTPVLMNLMLAGRHKKKLIVHLGSHTLYFMLNKKFGPLNNWLHKKALASYDALFCEGKMSAEFVRKLNLRPQPKTYTTFLGPPASRQEALSSAKPDLTSDNILLIANGPTEFRKFYKGMDVMFASFNRIFEKFPGKHIIIAGEWEEAIIQELMSQVSDEHRKKIEFLGKVNDIPELVLNACLCIHCTRGDAFPTSTIECMMAGLPVIVSNETGTKEIVEKVNSWMVVPQNPQDIAGSVIRYLNLYPAEKNRISASFRQASQIYTEETAADHYAAIFKQAIKDWA